MNLNEPKPKINFIKALSLKIYLNLNCKFLEFLSKGIESLPQLQICKLCKLMVQEINEKLKKKVTT